MEVGGSVCSWVETTEESWAESEALSNVRVHGQDCRVSTCYPPGLAAQAIIKPLGGATACHYSKTQTHTQEFTHPHMPHEPPWLHQSEARWSAGPKKCKSLSLVIKHVWIYLLRPQFTHTLHNAHCAQVQPTKKHLFNVGTVNTVSHAFQMIPLLLKVLFYCLHATRDILPSLWPKYLKPQLSYRAEPLRKVLSCFTSQIYCKCVQ